MVAQYKDLVHMKQTGNVYCVGDFDSKHACKHRNHIGSGSVINFSQLLQYLQIQLLWKFYNQF